VDFARAILLLGENYLTVIVIKGAFRYLHNSPKALFLQVYSAILLTCSNATTNKRKFTAHRQNAPLHIENFIGSQLSMTAPREPMSCIKKYCCPKTRRQNFQTAQLFGTQLSYPHRAREYKPRRESRQRTAERN